MLLINLLFSLFMLLLISGGALLIERLLRVIYRWLATLPRSLQFVGDAFLTLTAAAPLYIVALGGLLGIRLGGPLDSLPFRVLVVIITLAVFSGWWAVRHPLLMLPPLLLVMWVAAERIIGLPLWWGSLEGRVPELLVAGLGVTGIMLAAQVVLKPQTRAPSLPAKSFRWAAVVGVSLVALFIMAAGGLSLFGAPYQPDATAIYAQRSAVYPLGADYLGRSVLARAVEAYRITLILGLLAAGGAALLLHFAAEQLLPLARAEVLMPGVWLVTALSPVELPPTLFAVLLALTLLPVLLNAGQGVSVGGLCRTLAYTVLLLTGLSIISPQLIGPYPLSGEILAQKTELAALIRVTGDSRGIIMLGGWALWAFALVVPLLLVEPPHD